MTSRAERFKAAHDWVLEHHAKLFAKFRAPSLDVPLSERARVMLEEGIASAKRGEIHPMGDFTKYIDDRRLSYKDRFRASLAWALDAYANTLAKLAKDKPPDKAGSDEDREDLEIARAALRGFRRSGARAIPIAEVKKRQGEKR